MKNVYNVVVFVFLFLFVSVKVNATVLDGLVKNGAYFTNVPKTTDMCTHTQKQCEDYNKQNNTDECVYDAVTQCGFLKNNVPTTMVCYYGSDPSGKDFKVINNKNHYRRVVAISFANYGAGGGILSYDAVARAGDLNDNLLVYPGESNTKCGPDTNYRKYDYCCPNNNGKTLVSRFELYEEPIIKEKSVFSEGYFSCPEFIYMHTLVPADDDILDSAGIPEKYRVGISEDANFTVCGLENSSRHIKKLALIKERK